MYFSSKQTKPSLRAAFGTVIMLTTVSLVNPAMGANRNTILDKLETAPTNWQVVDVDVSVNGSPDAPIALGQTVTINVNSTEPANFLLAIVDTYGNVKVARPTGTGSSATYEYQADAPVGSYSTFAFASDTAIVDETLKLPAAGTANYLPIGASGVEQFLTTLTNHGNTGKVAGAGEYLFAIEDESLTAMRGIRKSISNLKKSEPKPAIKDKPIETTAVTEKPPVATQAETVATVDTEQTAAAKVIATRPAEPEIGVRRTQERPAVSRPEAPSASQSLTLDIKFRINSRELTQSGINALDTLGSALLDLQRSNELPQIILEGHTDDTGDGAYNLKLSQRRANSARDYLLQRFGLPDNTVAAQGYGESSPKVANVDRASREINRRVELRVIN